MGGDLIEWVKGFGPEEQSSLSGVLSEDSVYSLGSSGEGGGGESGLPPPISGSER